MNNFVQGRTWIARWINRFPTRFNSNKKRDFQRLSCLDQEFRFALFGDLLWTAMHLDVLLKNLAKLFDDEGVDLLNQNEVASVAGCCRS